MSKGFAESLQAFLAKQDPVLSEMSKTWLSYSFMLTHVKHVTLYSFLHRTTWNLAVSLTEFHVEFFEIPSDLKLTRSKPKHEEICFHKLHTYI